MRRRLLITTAISLAFGTAPLIAAPPAPTPSYQPPTPTQPVAVVRYTWHDEARNRDVPVKIYYPAKGPGPFPIIIFSHGLGGTREGYEYLGRYWAGCGFVSVHLQHLGSDDAVWKNAGDAREAGIAMKNAVTDVSNALNRAGDVPFAIDQMIKLNTAADSPLRGRLDTVNIGMSGHSFGGWSTMAAVGEQLGPDKVTMADHRIKAGVEMSAPVPPPAERDQAFDKITIPVFHMTGTLDDSPLGDTKASERRIIFDKTTHAETCLVIFNGADHMTFSGHIIPRASDAVFHPLICAGSAAFWDAYLRGNAAAKDWLYNGGFAALIGDKGTFEKKQPLKN
jgi:predicted dienelactone hydrolase